MTWQPLRQRFLTEKGPYVPEKPINNEVAERTSNNQHTVLGAEQGGLDGDENALNFNDLHF